MNSKTPYSIIAALSFTVLSCSPSPSQLVIDSFVNQFPEAEDVCWKLEYDGTWEVSFYLEKFQYVSATYNSLGNWISTEKEVFEDDIPPAQLTLLRKNFPNAFLVKTYKKIKIDGDEYEFELEKDGDIIVIVRSENDQYVQSKNETSDLEDEFQFEND